MNRLFVSVSAALGGGLVLAAAAVAQTPVGRGYGGDGGNVQQDVAGTGAPGGAAGSLGGTLPFTGLDLAVILVAAVVLIVAGLAIRRFSRPAPTA